MARVGDVEYATLPAALNAAEDGDTVTLLKDHTTDEENPSMVAAVKKRLTLDLNSFSVDSLSVGEPTYNGETGENIG